MSILGTRQLAITVEPLRHDHYELVQMFDKSRGRDHLATLLTEAGITDGEWLFRVCDTYRTRGTPRPLQIRRFDHTGVHIWMKYGDNGSGVKGVLVVTKDKCMTPSDLFDRLKAKTAENEPFRNQPTVLPHAIEPDDATIFAILTTANDLAAQRWAKLDSFLEAMCNSLGDVVGSPADLLEILETLVDKELMSTHKTAYATTPNGQARLDAALTELTSPIPEAVAVNTPTVSGVPVLLVDDPNDIVALVTHHKAKLERLLKLPELVSGSRKRQKEMKTQIKKLMDELELETAKEKTMLMECDPAAVRLLLEG